MDIPEFSHYRSLNKVPAAINYYKQAMNKNPFLWTAFARIVDEGTICLNKISIVPYECLSDLLLLNTGAEISTSKCFPVHRVATSHLTTPHTPVSNSAYVLYCFLTNY